MFKCKVFFFIFSCLLLFSFKNDDNYVLVLRIPSIVLYTKVYQYTDNKYYLEHDENGDYNKYGSIFMDYRNSINDKKILIFGHNSKSHKTKFSKLEMFLSLEFFNETNNRYIYLESGKSEYKYLVKSILIVDDSSQHMYLNYSKKGWISHINWINNNSIYKSDIKKDSNILILQTCLFDNPKGKYLLVVGEKIT